MWIVEQRVVADNENDLGLGWVSEVEHRLLTVFFPKENTFRKYALPHPPIRRVVFEKGKKFFLKNSDQARVIDEVREKDGLFYLQAEGCEYPESDVLHVEQGQGALDLMASGFTTSFESYRLRQDLFELSADYAQSSLQGLLAPRVQLLDHQLDIAMKLGSQKKVKAILADEVGLGKTIEAGLIFSRLRKRGGLKRSLIVIPEALQTQWMAEFYRKFFEIFVWTDLERWEQDQESQQSSSFALNDKVLVPVEVLRDNPEMLDDLLLHKWDLVIFDEAHKLCGEDYKLSSDWAMAEKILATSTSRLLLSATPERAGPNTLEGLSVLLGEKKPVAYRNRRRHFPGFPERKTQSYVYEKKKDEWLLNFLQAQPLEEKFLIITESSAESMRLHRKLKELYHSRIALFTEKQDFVSRDKQAAWFASEGRESAQVLLSSSLGGEGRNFQCAKNLILWDMPQSADTLEQRIGRIDRIGQGREIFIHVPLLKGSQDEMRFEFFLEGTRSFREFCPFAYEIEKHCDVENSQSKVALIAKATEEYEKALSNYEESLKSDNFYLASATASQAKKDIVAWEKQDLTKSCLLGILDSFGVDYKADTLKDSFIVHSDSTMFLENFPGLNPEESKSVTFDRATALVREDYDFVSFEHPFFEGATDVFEQNNSGKVGLCAWENPAWKQRFLLSCFFVSENGSFLEVLASDKGELLTSKEISFDSAAIKKLPKAVASEAAKRATDEVGAALAKIEAKLKTDEKMENFQLDSFFVFLPMQS